MVKGNRGCVCVWVGGGDRTTTLLFLPLGFSKNTQKKLFVRSRQSQSVKVLPLIQKEQSGIRIFPTIQLARLSETLVSSHASLSIGILPTYTLPIILIEYDWLFIKTNPKKSLLGCQTTGSYKVTSCLQMTDSTWCLMERENRIPQGALSLFFSLSSIAYIPPSEGRRGRDGQRHRCIDRGSRKEPASEWPRGKEVLLLTQH